MPKVYVKPAKKLRGGPKYYQTSLKNLIYRLRSLNQPGIIEALKEGVAENETVILDLVREDQLYGAGVNGRDIPIWSYSPYTQVTIRTKLEKQQPADRVTLCDTRAFYNSMQIAFTEKGFYIEASTSYTPDILEKYGHEVLRLTNEHFNLIVVPLLRIYVFDYLYKMLYTDDPHQATVFANKMKSRLKKDFRNLNEYLR